MPGCRRQQGVALAIVVWFIAGMSLLVAGIVAQARVDTHMAQVHVARAKSVAAGDGAIQLMMADLSMDKFQQGDSPGMPVGHYRLGDVEVSVSLVPSSALIDIKSASAEVLTALFQLAGGLGENQSRQLAENVLESRTIAPGLRGRNSAIPRLDAMEDLLRLPGMTRTLLDAIRDFIVVGDSAQGTNWSLASETLLGLLDQANPEQADAVRSRRDGGVAQTGRLAGNYRADAIVRYGDKIWLRRRWISMEASTSSALPWRIVRTEPPRVLMKDSFLLDGSTDA